MPRGRALSLRATSLRGGASSPRAGALPQRGRACSLRGGASSSRAGALSPRERALSARALSSNKPGCPRASTRAARETGFSLARGPVAQGNRRAPRGGGYAKCAFFLRGSQAFYLRESRALFLRRGSAYPARGVRALLTTVGSMREGVLLRSRRTREYCGARFPREAHSLRGKSATPLHKVLDVPRGRGAVEGSSRAELQRR